jgi:Holliday junction DNA helicase RuvB
VSGDPDRVQDRNVLPEEQEDLSIRPLAFPDFIGQETVKETLRIAIAAAKKRGEPLEHILFSGPPGLGKTTMAHIIAREMSAGIQTTSGPVLERPGDLAAILTGLQEGDVLFIDEIHRLSTTVEEVLYPAMEDYSIDVMIGEGPSARSIRLSLEHFTLIGATTRIGMLGSPFRDRFGMVCRHSLYQVEDLQQIVLRSASILGIPITDDGALEIGKRSRGTPRIANRLLRRVRDYAVVITGGTITCEVADRALMRLGIDSLGLDEVDRRILSIVAKDFSGGPVGLKTIAIAVGEDTRTIEEVYEPYLIQIGFIRRTPQGRMTTPAVMIHLGSAPREGTLDQYL